MVSNKLGLQNENSSELRDYTYGPVFNIKQA